MTARPRCSGCALHFPPEKDEEKCLCPVEPTLQRLVHIIASWTTEGTWLIPQRRGGGRASSQLYLTKVGIGSGGGGAVLMEFAGQI